MPLPQGFGNNDVEGTAECFCLREAENSGGAAVPQADHSLGVRIDDRIRHGIGLVVGETAVIGDDVSILHEVTLGGTGKERGDRHPKVRDGVLMCAAQKCSAMSRLAATPKSVLAVLSRVTCRS